MDISGYPEFLVFFKLRELTLKESDSYDDEIPEEGLVLLAQLPRFGIKEPLKDSSEMSSEACRWFIEWLKYYESLNDFDLEELRFAVKKYPENKDFNFDVYNPKNMNGINYIH